MSFDVNLGFKVTTDGLNEVISNIDKLTTAVGKFNKAEIDSARLSAANAKAAEAKEKANKAAAQALQAEIVLTDKNNDLQDKAAKKAQATAVAQSNVAQATSVSTNALDRQKDVLAYMTEGFSRGQASTLAYAKASGLAADQLRELGQVLQTQRKLIGGDTFDKSISGLISLQNQFKEAGFAIDQYNAKTGLTKQQTRDLSRDQERLTLQMVSQGKSISDINTALVDHSRQYVEVANKLNTLTRTEKEHERVQRESANATRAVSKEEERMISIMNSLNNQTNMNASFSEKAAIAEANYARNLRLAGVSAEDATKRLSAYRQQQVLVAAEEQKRQQLYLQRGLQPQIGDVVVSLAGGQNPLTVMLQQGDQIRGLIAQTGVQGEALAASMRAAFSGTIESIKMTAGAMSGVLVGAITTLGTSLLNVVTGPFTGFREGMRQATAEGTTGMLKLSSAIQAGFKGANMAFLAALPAMFVAAAAAIGVYAFAMFQIVKEQNELSKSLILTGASLSLSKSAAIDLASSMKDLSVNTTQGIEVLTSLAKEGVRASGSFEIISKAAIEMQKVTGQSIEDTVKEFKKIGEDPVDALTKFGIASGAVNPDIIDRIKLLQDEGRQAEAVALATEVMAKGMIANANDIRANLSPLEKVWLDIKGATVSTYESFKDAVRESEGFAMIIRTAWELVAVSVSEVWYVLKQTGKEIGGIAAQIAAVATGDFSLASKIGDEMKASAKSAREEQDKFVNSLLNRNKADEAGLKIGAEVRKSNSDLLRGKQELSKLDEKSLSDLDKYKKAVSTVSNNAAFKSGDSEAVAAGLRVIAKAQKDYNEALEKANKPSKEARAAMKQAIKDEEVYGNLIAKSVNFTDTYAEEVQALNRYAGKAKLTQDEYNQAYFALLEKQPYFIALKKDEADGIKAVSDAIKLENQLLGKAEDLGKDYYDQLVKIGLAHATGTFSPARIEAMIQRLNEATPAAKALSKAWEDVNNEILKNQKSAADRSEAATVALDSETEKLALQLSLVGKSEEQKKREIKLLEIKLARIKEIDQIEKDFALNSNKGEKDRRIAEAFNREEQAKRNLNTEIAVDAATKYADEMKKAAEDISEAIATALFEGGDKGAKKLKASLTKMFREKITIAIQGEVKGMMGLPGGTSAISDFLGGGASTGGASGWVSAANGASLAGTVASFAAGASNFVAGLSAGFSQFSAGVSTFASVANGAAVGGSTGLGISIGAAGPYIAAALALYAIYKGTQGETRSGGQYGYGQTDAGNYGKLNSQLIQGPSGGQIQGKAVQDAIDSTVSGINGLLKKLGSSATLVGFQAALESSKNDRGGVYAGGTLSTGAKFGEAGLGGGRTNYNGTLYETTSANSLDSETAMKNFSTDLIQATLQAIQAAADIPKSIRDMLAGVDVEALSQENATALLNSVVAMSEFSAALKTLPFANLQDLSYEASVALSDLMGGLGGLSSALSTYYQNFYSESERQANTLKSVEGAFNSLGITMPDISKGSDSARAEFRKLVEAQDLSTEAGRRNYATLLQLSGTFAELTPLLDEATNAWKDLTDSILEEVQRIRGVINSGENQSLSSAQAAFDLATTLARAGDKDAAASLPELSKTLLDIAAKQATSLTELRRIQYITAGSLEQTATVIPKFATGGDYSGGLALVGEKGPELINFSSGGYVANASNTANLLDNNSVLDLLDKVNTNLDGMRYELRSNVTHVAKTAKLLDRVIPDGASVQVTVVNP